MPDLEQLNKQKERILNTIRFRGPSLPVQIAKVLGITPLFANVFLAELRTEGKLKVSDMRVGSSPLYFLQGQEHQLEGFTKFLNEREREAVAHLKKNLVVREDELTPVIRVAMKSIKDFAIPIRVEQQTFWKYFTLTKNDFENVLSEKFSGNGENKQEAELSVAEKVVEKLAERVQETVLEKVSEVKKLDTIEKKAEEKINRDFIEVLKNYLNGKEIDVLDVFAEKKKEFEARVRIDGKFGKQEFYLVAKDKKSITDKDFEQVWDKAHKKRLQGLFVSSGEMNKKAKEHLREWGNLVKFEKLDISQSLDSSKSSRFEKLEG